jgi:putative flippase GtrA
MKTIPFFQREVNKQFIRFCLIGLTSTVLTYLVFTILFYFFSVNYLISTALGFIAGLFLGYIFNKLYTFGSFEKDHIAIPKYFIIYAFTLTFSLVGMRYLVGSVGLNPLISYAFIVPIITLVNFFGTKIFAFKNEKW